MSEPDPRTDAELVAAANDGEAEAFTALYTRYRDWTVRLAFRFTCNREDALDVLQETFAYLLKKFPGFRLTAAMTTFLYPVVKNTSLAIIRKRRRQPITSDPAIDPPAPPPPPDDSRPELAAVLSGLPAGQREVLLMRFVDDMSLAQIAAALAIPLGTVKSRLHHALGRLRDDARTRRYFEA